MKTNYFLIIAVLIASAFLVACTNSVKRQSLIYDSGVKLTKGQFAYVIPGRSVTFTSQSAEELAEVLIEQFCKDIF
jgi:hypothetical protein